MDALKRNWKMLLVVGAVLGAVLAGVVYYKVIRVDPEFTAKQQKLDQQRKVQEKALGVDSAEDDFADLESELEATADEE